MTETIAECLQSQYAVSKNISLSITMPSRDPEMSNSWP